MKILLLLSLFSFIACKEKAPTSPEGVLSSYVKKRFDGASINELSSYMSPGFKEKLSDLKDTKYNQLDNYRKKQFKLISKGSNCVKGKTCNITYYVSYVETKGGESKFDTETKKIANLIKEGDSWVIDEINHIKTYHDIKDKIQINAQ